LALHDGEAMMRSIKVRALLACLSLLAIAGCGDGGAHLRTNDGRFATVPGQSVLVASVTAFSVTSLGGGFGPSPPPQGAACDPQLWTYTVHLDTSTFEWDSCDVSGSATDPASYTHATGSRPLSSAELQTAGSSARAVHVSERDSCGADKQSMFMSVSTAASQIIYGDDFYACAKMYDHYVNSDEISALSTDLYELDTH
jgi:hypothetical protein